MTDRQTLEHIAIHTADEVVQLEVVVEILLDIRDLLSRLQPPQTIYSPVTLPPLNT